MENAIPEKQSPFATEPVGRLILRFAIPSVIALLVNSLYNIVDQIFIGWGVGYLGNGATNVVFPITIIALALAMMIGNGGAAYLSLKLGERQISAAEKGVGNAVTLVTVVSILLALIFLIWIDPILSLFGATDVLRPYALEYGYIIGIGLPFMMISAAINSMIRADGSPKYAMFSMVIGAIINVILDPVFIFVFHMGVQGAAIATIIGQIASFAVSVVYMPRFKTVRSKSDAFRLNGNTCGNIITFGLSSFITQFAITIVMALTNNLLSFYGAASPYGAEIPLIASEVVSIAAFFIFQFAPMSVISLFGTEDALYNTFATMALRIFLLLCPLTGFQTIAAVYLQAVGKPVKPAILSLARQIIFFIPTALILPKFLGVTGVLWTGPVADGLAFILSLFFIIQERTHLKRQHALETRDERS